MAQPAAKIIDLAEVRRCRAAAKPAIQPAAASAASPPLVYWVPMWVMMVPAVWR